MEPQLPTPRNTPETGPAHFPGGETFSGVQQPELAPKQPERQETHEQHVGGPSGDPASVVAVPILPPLPTMTPTPVSTQPFVHEKNPIVAADEDLIEKEWVERAKKVVAETKHDPYLQGQQVSQLQADYLKKRYGKTVNVPTDGA
ncbi:MAG: hypothetical protein ABIR46_01470 [Candidatus Saccharimonadales bacterium]